MLSRRWKLESNSTYILIQAISQTIDLGYGKSKAKILFFWQHLRREVRFKVIRNQKKMQLSIWKKMEKFGQRGNSARLGIQWAYPWGSKEARYNLICKIFYNFRSSSVSRSYSNLCKILFDCIYLIFRPSRIFQRFDLIVLDLKNPHHLE